MEVTNHAIERMYERGITFDDVNRVAENGSKKEIQNNKEGIIYKVALDSVVLIITDNGRIITTYKENSKKKKKKERKKKRWEEHYSHSKKNLAYKKRKFELRRKDYEDELV